MVKVLTPSDSEVYLRIIFDFIFLARFCVHGSHVIQVCRLLYVSEHVDNPQYEEDP
jgi:hypothetical protein